MEQILFGGAVISPVANNQFPPFRKKEGINNWFDIVEQAFFQLTSTEEGKAEYGDPNKGATLEQVWRTSQIFTGKRPVCLLAAGKPDVPTAAIEKLVRMNAKQMVEVFKRTFALTDKVGIQVLYYDGKIGHSISLQSYDKSTSRFVYHDPWPDFSLLSKEYNAAGVDAKRVSKQIWSVTSEELERVVFASFIYKNFWAALSGEKFGLTLAELQQTDFWKFFFVKIVETKKEGEGTVHHLKTGGFQSEVDLMLKTNLAEDVDECRLYLNRSWILGPPYGINPFALDIVRSFIAATVSPVDAANTKATSALFQVEELQKSIQLLQANKDEAAVDPALKVYFGMTENHTIPMEYSTIRFENADVDQIKRFVVVTEIDNIN